MAIVLSFGSFQGTKPPDRASVFSSRNAPIPYGYNEQYAAIYATQPNVRTCVDFLARNIAQLGFHVFRRVSDTDRQRLTDHDLAQWIRNPNPYTTTYRLFESLVADCALYFNAYWLKVRLDQPTRRIGLVRIPPAEMRVEGGLLPARFVWTVNGIATVIDPSEVVYFNGYNPLNALMGLAPVETLRRVLAEEKAASDYRATYWQNASRIEGVIERPATAPKWTVPQKQSWREQWREKHAGPSGAGSIPVLEDGMTFKAAGYSARDSEYAAARKLGREEVASAFHIPLPMVGILEHATFSNIKEQHKQLYADCLGPWTEMIVQAIELQLLPETRDPQDVYAEFNIAEKLKGSFEEQANALRLLIGRPVMTANEGRARLNLPRIADDPSADELAAQQGGPAAGADPGVDPAAADPAQAQGPVAAIVRAHLTRQAARLTRYTTAAEKARALDLGRCVSELAEDLTPLLGRLDALTAAARITDHTYTLLLEGRDPFAADREVGNAA